LSTVNPGKGEGDWVETRKKSQNRTTGGDSELVQKGLPEREVGSEVWKFWSLDILLLDWGPGNGEVVTQISMGGGKEKSKANQG